MKRICAVTLAFIATLRTAMASCSGKESDTEQEEQKPDTPDEGGGEEPGDNSGNESNNEYKILVAYYSHSGNTRIIAG